MSWGYKILVFYIIFIGMMLTMVYGTYQHSVNLVSKDYYEQELMYQEVIDGSKNYATMKQRVDVNLYKNTISILWPDDIDLNLVKKVQIWLYNEADSAGDIRFGIEALDMPIIEIPLGEQQQGNYTLKIQWKKDDTPYYLEKSFRL
jgi:hypothetical protein